MAVKQKAKPKPKAKPIMGRPPFKVDYDKLTEITSVGKEITKIAEALDMSRTTFYKLLGTDEKFIEAYEAGMNNRKYQLEQALYKRASGYQAEEIQTVTDSEGKVTKKVTEKSYVPDTTALIFALSNRYPERYRDVKEIHNTTNINITVKDIQRLTDEQLYQYIDIPQENYNIE